MPTGDVYTIDIHQTYQQNPNVMCWQAQLETETVEAAILTDLRGWVNDKLVPKLKPLQVPGVKFNCSQIRQLHPNASLPDINDLLNSPGTRSPGTDELPGQLSNVVTLFSDVVNPTGRNRGRDFWYGQFVGDLFTDGTQYAGAWITAVLDFYAELSNRITGDAGNIFDIGIFSRTQALENDNPDEVGDDGIKNSDRETFGQDVFKKLILVRTDGLVRTQRRRQPENPCQANFSSPVTAVEATAQITS